MDVKEAIELAKASVRELFGDQLSSAPQLEEVEFDGVLGIWIVTIGFLLLPERMLVEAQEGDATARRGGFAFDIPRRARKVIKINNATSVVVSIKDRESD